MVDEVKSIGSDESFDLYSGGWYFLNNHKG